VNLYIAEILLGYQPSKGIRSSVFQQKWPIANAVRVLVQRFGLSLGIFYLTCFLIKIPHSIIQKLSREKKKKHV